MKIDRETTLARIEALKEARMVARQAGFRTHLNGALFGLAGAADEIRRARTDKRAQRTIERILPELERIEKSLGAQLERFEQEQADRDLELMTKAPNAFNLWGFFGLFS